ncbi:MAG: tetratricopeptide repeat protein [Granulicella sp.]
MQNPTQGTRRPLRRAPLPLTACLCILLAHTTARGQAIPLDTLLEHARAAQSAGRYTEAADAYIQAVAIDPHTPELWANLGLIQHLTGQYLESANSFTHALDLKPALFMPQLFLGLDQLELNKPEAARLHLERAHALRPDDPKVALGLGRVYTALHRPHAAATAYATAAKNDPTNQSAWYGLGLASITLIEQDGGTLATYAPDSVWARALYADDLLQQGRTTEALDTYRKVVGTAERKTLLQTLKATSAIGAIKSISPETQRSLLTILETAAETAPTCTQSCAHIAAHQQMASLYWQNQPGASADAALQRIQVAPTDNEALFWSVKANCRSRIRKFAPRMSPLTLWFLSPGTLLTSSLAIGNGRLDAMLFGAPEHNQFLAVEHT